MLCSSWYPWSRWGRKRHSIIASINGRDQFAGRTAGELVFEFGQGLAYSEITENYVDDNTVILENKGEYDVNYSLLKYEYIPHKSLCDFKQEFIKAGQQVTVKF